MSIIITLITIIQTFSIALGTGSSTLAIINFFAAIADGTIDETERRMMGIVYIVLRVAMVSILLTSTFLIVQQYTSGSPDGITGFMLSQIVVLAVLFINAMLMTAHLVPSTIGPGLQAGSWYTLGVLVALQELQQTDFSIFQFLLGYSAWLILAIGIVNGIMAVLKARRQSRVAE